MTESSGNLRNGSDSDDRAYVIVVHGLYLASAFLGITAIVGLVLAYVRKGEGPDWALSHYRYAIRTFWIGLLYGLISLVLCLVLIGFVMLFAVWVWFVIRSVVPIVKALNEEEIRDVETWLI